MTQRSLTCTTHDTNANWCPDCEAKARLVSVLMEPQRIKIIRLLRSGEQCVCEIEHVLSIPQNLVSHHLRVLREAGLVSARKEGQFVHYSRVEDRILVLTQALTELLST
ncbi:MAG: metalloregulator ArsR/SmtB family transcription factor [Caldisericia bacterium]